MIQTLKHKLKVDETKAVLFKNDLIYFTLKFEDDSLYF